MAILYRWRKSTVQTLYDTESKNSSSNPKYFEVGAISGDYTVYYATSYTLNDDGTVTLKSPTTGKVSSGWPLDVSSQYYSAISITTDEIFKNNSSGSYARWESNSSVRKKIVYAHNGGTCIRYYNFREGPGVSQGYVYSTSSSAYPNGGVSGSYWYDQRTTININITVPSIVMEGKGISVSWNAVSGATEYFLERQADGGSWTQVYNGSTNSYTDTAGAWSNVKYRLRMTISGTMTPYVESSTCQVVSASTLAISGTDGDLGTLTSDVEYTVISDGDSAITVTEAVDGVYTKTFTATAGATNKISVLDLLTGTGSIHITASTNPGSGVIEVERAWTYSKTAAMFSAYGNTAELKRNGVPVWPLTLAECVRLPGGETLDEVTALPVANIETGSYVGTGTSGSGNPTTLTFAGKPIAVFVAVHISAATNGKYISMPFVRGSEHGCSVQISGNSMTGYELDATWGDTTLQFYSLNGAEYQLNSSGVTYDYVALTLQGGDTE